MAVQHILPECILYTNLRPQLQMLSIVLAHEKTVKKSNHSYTNSKVYIWIRSTGSGTDSWKIKKKAAAKEENNNMTGTAKNNIP